MRNVPRTRPTERPVNDAADKYVLPAATRAKDGKSVWLPRALYKRIKIKAAQEDLRVGALVAQLVEKSLAEEE
jgi:predicted DNA-binding ribbon-helix-helix protein